jgi:asparagine synthase (glutamine-hydrolysing)
MCGICGKVMFDPAGRVPKALLKSMADAMAHRGPDDEGFYVSHQVGLGFRRLSIIDLGGGHQPLSNEDQTIWVIFNGEIYNFQALRRDLITRGHVFRTNSDTEVIVHLYEQYGSDCVTRLRGMFAFALWDSNSRTLLLARDRVGIKPLYYHLGKHFLSFASEVKSLLADSELEVQVDTGMIDRFLTYQYVPGKRTLMRNVFKLEPGHILIARNGRCDIRRYWDLAFPPAGQPESSGKYKEELVALLDETVQLHMISDVPVGFLLSGGIDSTAMLSFAARKTNKPISTFTIGFASDSVVDERPFARLAAKRYGSDHYEITISPQEFAAFLPSYVWHMEEPVCQPPAVALYYVSQLASQHVKVLISGEGGDEAFAGYETYRNLFWFEHLKRLLGPLRAPAGLVMSSLGEKLDSRVLCKYGPRMLTPFEQYYFSRTTSPFDFFRQQGSSVYSEEMLNSIDIDDSVSVTKEYLARARSFTLMNKMLYVDTKTWLPDELLVKADKMTMANSVELRVPLLDHVLLEFAARLPRRQKVRGWTMKYLLKEALQGHVPDEILYRRKAGFPVPYDTWLRNELRTWVADVLLDHKSVSRGYFRRDAIENLLRLYGEGRGYSKEVFSLLVLELWHRVFIDRRAEPIGAVGIRGDSVMVAGRARS